EQPGDGLARADDRVPGAHDLARDPHLHRFRREQGQQRAPGRDGRLHGEAARRAPHAILVDYTIDDGESATTWIDIQAIGGAQQNIAAGSRVWATPEGDAPMPYEIGLGLVKDAAGTPDWVRHSWINSAWNAIEVHVPDPAHPCLLAGATELYLVGAFPT